jgi:hypothetical protein
MGWPASSHAPYMDYILADRVVAAPHLLPHGFTEKVIYMPHSYYATDYAQSSPRSPDASHARQEQQQGSCGVVGEEAGTATRAERVGSLRLSSRRRELRREEGLPTAPDVVVFCSFNQVHDAPASAPCLPQLCSRSRSR